MDREKMKNKIAITLSSFPIFYLTFIIDFINLLSEKFDIELFLHNSGSNMPKFNNNVRIRLIAHNKTKKSHSVRQLLGKETIVKLKIFSQKRYFAIIGIESLGLVMANILNKNNKQKLFYYNFELYDKNQKGVWQLNYNFIKQLEKNILLESVDKLIIQDKDREIAYKKIINLNKRIDVCYLPVSLRDITIKTEKSNNELINIMYYGQLSPIRFNTHMVLEAQKFDVNIKLSINAVSFIGNQYVEELKSLDLNNKVIFNLKHTKYNEIYKDIQEATIGLVFYRDTVINERLTGKSSVKLAHYMQVGIPIIGFKHTSLNKIVNDYNIGITISNLSELNNAIHIITENYEYYQQNVKKAYKLIYSLNQHINKLTKVLIHE